MVLGVLRVHSAQHHVQRMQQGVLDALSHPFPSLNKSQKIINIDAPQGQGWANVGGRIGSGTPGQGGGIQSQPAQPGPKRDSCFR
jgi:hypothetical protein